MHLHSPPKHARFGPGDTPSLRFLSRPQLLQIALDGNAKSRRS